jgi:hypothetical protein
MHTTAHFISHAVLSLLIGGVFAGVTVFTVGGRLITWSETRDRKAGSEPIGRGCTGVLLTLLLAAIAGSFGAWIGWVGL